LREHPDFITDLSKNNTLIALHDVAKRQAGSEFSDMYFERMEDLLGLKPAPQQSNRGNGAQHQTSTRSAPVRQQYSGPAVSAPPHRDVPSMGTGRPQSFRAPLTQAEKEIARVSGGEEEYQRNKERLAREKAAGLHGNG
jgi:hypothetical protein